MTGKRRRWRRGQWLYRMGAPGCQFAMAEQQLTGEWKVSHGNREICVVANKELAQKLIEKLARTQPEKLA
jgi:hypothetical protein